MKKMLGIAAMTLAIAAGTAGTAGASSNCKTMKCVNTALTSLQGKVRTMQASLVQDNRFLGVLANCLSETAITDYSGYNYTQPDGSSITTTAIDYTQSGSTPDVWVMSDKCNTAPAAARDTVFGSNVFGPIAPRLPWTFAPQVKR